MNQHSCTVRPLGEQSASRRPLREDAKLLSIRSNEQPQFSCPLQAKQLASQRISAPREYVVQPHEDA
jgi:hypothetical protein